MLSVRSISIVCVSLLILVVANCENGGKCPTCPTGTSNEIRDYDYVRGTYFFLDHMYMENYENYEMNDQNYKWVHLSVPEEFIIDSLIVFIDDVNASNNAEEGARLTYAYVNPSRPDSAADEFYEGYFRLLDIDEYFVNGRLGYIRMNTQLRDGWVLAVTYKQRQNRDIPRQQGGWIGNYYSDPTDTTVSILKLVRPHTPRPGQTTWELEWKNVYALGSTNIPEDGLDVKVFLDGTEGDDVDSQGEVKYISIMGLDKFNNQSPGVVGADGLLDSWDAAFLNLSRGELIFPTLRPFDTDFAFEVDETLDIRVPEIYDEANQAEREQASKYYLRVSY
jgi:cell surface protein SprA